MMDISIGRTGYGMFTGFYINNKIAREVSNSIFDRVNHVKLNVIGST